MFETLGFTPEEVQDQFGFLLNAFRYGTPPHGGCAFGMDRLAMILSGGQSIRDVIAFPKAQNASCLMMQAPAKVQESQLEELCIAVTCRDEASE
jgi:aspartyl-tRNA synthetase